MPEHPDLTLDDVTIDNVQRLKLLGVTFDPKLTFEQHIIDMTSKLSQKIGILRKCWQIYPENSLILKCFYSFILPFFEYCSVVWMSAADTYLRMIQRVFDSARFFIPIGIDLHHRRNVAALCILYRTLNNVSHPLHSKIPGPANPLRRTRRAQRMNSRALLSALKPNSVQFNRTFLPHTIELWNFLPQDAVDSLNMDGFKRKVNRHLLALA